MEDTLSHFDPLFLRKYTCLDNIFMGSDIHMCVFEVFITVNLFSPTS